MIIVGDGLGYIIYIHCSLYTCFILYYYILILILYCKLHFIWIGSYSTPNAIKLSGLALKKTLQNYTVSIMEMMVMIRYYGIN